jgi:hypothetical protein
VASDSDVEDFPVDVLDQEDDVKRFEQKALDAEKKAHMFDAWSFRNVRQRTEGPRSWCAVRMYLATVLADTLNPNLASSACIRF